MNKEDYAKLLAEWNDPVDNPEKALAKLKAKTEAPEELTAENWDDPVDDEDAALRKLKKMMNSQGAPELEHPASFTQRDRPNPSESQHQPTEESDP